MVLRIGNRTLGTNIELRAEKKKGQLYDIVAALKRKCDVLLIPIMRWIENRRLKENDTFNH